MKLERTSSADSLPRYQTYLLRCWQERSQQEEEVVVVWRFSLENPHTGRRRGFASLEALLASLRTELGNDDVVEDLDPKSM